ncbi:MAG: CoA pyrophosphatase [Rhodothermia bacterium]|nr:MAG: CoA pyrophosphatase [Rhodothermia bacterium]
MAALKPPMTQFASYHQFLGNLGRALVDPPGQCAQFEMAPEYRKNFDLASVNGRTRLEAAVMALFYPDKDDPGRPKLLLTLRPKGMTKHAGQVAFPGGRREAEEEFSETALRETEEEVSIPRSDIRILGSLTSLYIPPSNFYVQPFVGAVSHFPSMATTSDEVESVFGVSVEELRDPNIRTTTDKNISGNVVSVPCYQINDELVWGATAMLLAELVAVLYRF